MERLCARLWSLVLASSLAFLAMRPAAAHEVHPLGFIELPWRAENITRVTASLLDFHSGALVLSWTGLGRVERVGGRECLVGPYFLFDVADAWAFDIDETVTLRVELSKGRGVIASYDHASSAPVAKASSVGKAGNVVEVRLDRARFANRLFAGSDLALAAPGAIYPYDPRAEHEIAVCGIEITRQAGTAPSSLAEKPGRIELDLTDAENGAAVAARVGLFDQQGRQPLPSREAVRVRRYAEDLYQLPVVSSREFWPAPGGYAFYVDGHYEADIPAGQYELVVMKGPEYRVHRQRLLVTASQATPVQVNLMRWADAPKTGWYSGDVHVHVTRKQPDNPVVLAQMQGEDLHVTNVLQMANIMRVHFPQYAFGPEGRYVRDGHALVSGQESPRTGHRGHAIGLNGSRYHEPEHFFLYHEVAEALRADGGLFGYAHLLQDAFHASRGLALDAPLGLVDFVEVLQFGSLATDLYYDMLNLGLRLAPAGGSDYPYIDLPGAARSYVYIEDSFSPQAWFSGLRRGATFVSNAPLLTLDVNGIGMGQELRIEPGGSVTVNARARLNPDLDRLDRLELVAHGEVVASATSAAGAEELSLTHRLTTQSGMWIAVRAYGKGIAVAHSAPVYIVVGERPWTFSRERVPELVEKYTALLDGVLAAMPAAHEDLEHWDTGAALLEQWQEQLPALRAHALRARASLRAIGEQAARAR